jgi:preprotein translocase subunit SecA
MSVGQQDPLVEYRRRGQALFEDMQLALRHDVLRALFHAEPVTEDAEFHETELTRAARGSIAGAGSINTSNNSLTEEDFASTKVKKGQTVKEQTAAAKKTETKIKKTRKQERKRKAVARKRK